MAAIASNAPTSLSGTAGNGSATISFTAPSSNGGASISNYKYSTDGSTYTALNPADTTTPVTIPGLTNGTTYSITLKAVNSAGDSSASSSVSVTPRTTPGAPTIGTATTPSTTSAEVTFSAPASDGGSAITAYTVTAYLSNGTSAGVTASGSTSPITVTGLTPGTQYTFKVAATNVAGTGSQSSATSSVTTPIAPSNSIPPKISGSYSVGSTLTGSDGTWNNISGATTSRQWQSSSDGVTWTDISGATNSTYVLTSSELGKFIRFKIVQATSNGTSHAFSPATSGTSFSSPSKSGEVSLKFRDHTSLGLSDATYGNGSCDRNSLVFRANNTLVATLNSPSERITVLLYNDDIAESFKVIYSDSTSITYTTSNQIYAQTAWNNGDWSYPKTFETRSGTDVRVFLQAPAGLTITGFEIRWDGESRIPCQGLKE